MRLEDLPVDQLRYKWECDPEGDAVENAHLIECSRTHEKYLCNPEYQLGLWTAGSRIGRLFHDISAHGMQDPLCVYETSEPDVYRVELGNQRLAIARALGIKTVQCKVY